MIKWAMLHTKLTTFDIKRLHVKVKRSTMLCLSSEHINQDRNGVESSNLAESLNKGSVT